MNFSDVKLLLPASGYMKTSDDNGRTVIDEIRDASYERNHQTFAGDDRPELHKTLDGKYQMAVEKESTNELAPNNLKFDGPLWGVFGGSIVEITQGQALEPLTNNQATLIETSGGTSALKYKCQSYVDDVYVGAGSISLWIHNIGNTDLEVQEIKFGVTGVAVSTVLAGEKKYVQISGDSSLDGFKRFGFLAPTSSDDLSFIVYGLMIEKSPYPTLFNEGTRLAPSAVIQNALPETGTVAGVVDMVRDSSDIQNIFENNFSVGATLTTLGITPSNEFIVDFHGVGNDRLYTSVYSHIGFTENERSRFAFLMTVGPTRRYVFMNDSGQILSVTDSKSTSDTSFLNVNLGTNEAATRHMSFRFEKPFYKDNIVRVNATDDEIKTFFQTLTKGTSMEMTSSEMTIAP